MWSKRIILSLSTGLATAGAFALLALGSDATAQKRAESEAVAPAVGKASELIPTIRTPELRLATGRKADLSALPKGARAAISNTDLSRVFVTLPPKQASALSAAQVYAGVIAPIAKAAGVQPGALRAASRAGQAQARPSLEGLARHLATEYTDNKEAPRRRTFDMVNVFLGKAPANAVIDTSLQLVRGMTFAQFKADIERQEIIYPFLQMHGDTPIEHTGLYASRWEGQTVTSVRGALLRNYKVVNKKPVGGAAEARKRSYASLAAVKGLTKALEPRRGDDPPALVLLAYGDAPGGGAALRYVWRMTLWGYAAGREMPFLAWADAETFQILKMEPLVNDVVWGNGRIWRRDPGTGATPSRSFQVDDAAGGQYTLQLAGLASRVDHQGDGYDAEDVSISSSSGGSSATFANFDQAPINDGPTAICFAGGNPRFQQVHYFSLFHSNWSLALATGIFTPFPTSAWAPRLESATAGCNAWSDMDYGACEGYFNAACPNFSNGLSSFSNPATFDNFMNFAHDNGVVGHELAHNSVDRFTYTRPANWCGMAVCAMPVGWAALHDLADAWADHVENTNCTAGWVGKNIGGVDAAADCQGSVGHFEGGELPRLHEVSWPFNPAAPGDHFPEHRDAASYDYADMQIGAAALWQVREGMRSKCRPSGQPQYFVRFTRALKNTGFFGASPGTSDRGIYQYLQDLELEMIEQWATSGMAGGPPAFAHNGNHTTNKVTAGFAKTGLFAIPDVCLDGNAGTSDATFCPVGDNGADAVVDIEDNVPGDDWTLDGLTHPEHDFLQVGGVAPTFHVWTGPRYRFSGTSARPVTGTAPCNTEYNVEASTDATFAAGTVSSGWTGVDVDTGTAASPECYGTWTPTPAQWASLQSGGALSKIYYRVTTRDAAGANVRVSTQPAAGLWTVPPAYALLTADGSSDY